MAMIVDSRGHGPVRAPQVLSDQRLQLRRAAELRLSGATVEAVASNPADMRIPSFARVTYFDFADEGPVTPTAGRLVVGDDDDFDW